MKHFRLKVLLTVILAAGLIAVFGWLIALQNHSWLSGEVSKIKPLTGKAVKETLVNLSDTWTDYKTRLKNRYEVEAVFGSLALKNVIADGEVPEESRENGIVISIQDDKLSSSDPAVSRLGLDASLFSHRQGSFAAPNQPSTYVTYSRIGNTSDYFVKWYEDTVLDDVVRENYDIPGILKWTEITYDVLGIFVSCDEESGEISGIIYKNDRYFENFESLEDLGLTQEDLEENDGNNSGTLSYQNVRFSYVSGRSDVPAGYVILLEPVPDLYAKAFLQAGYMIAALLVLVITLLVAGFSLYPYVCNNILTPKAEKAYAPSHVKSTAELFGVLGLITIALCGIFSYSLDAMYDDVIRSRNRIYMMDDSISMLAERYTQNMQSFHDVYLDYGDLIAGFLDTYPQLRDKEVLSTLAESISASSITLYDSNGVETVSSGPWKDLRLDTDPASSSCDFRRILKGVPSIIHDPETDEVTGLEEMRLGIRIRDDSSDDRYGVMMLNIDISALTNYYINPEQAVRQIFQKLSDQETALWISDAETGRILISSAEEQEGEDVISLGLKESDLKGSLMKTLKTEEGDFFVTSVFMETQGILEWTGKSEGFIAYCRVPKTSILFKLFAVALMGCLLFVVIYIILAWIVLRGYTDQFFNTYKHVKGSDLPQKELGSIRRAIVTTSPGNKGLAALEISVAFILLQIVFVVNSNTPAARNTVYRFISAGDWERGFNLFSIAATLNLLSKLVLLVIGLRLLMAILASFSGSKGKTIFRLVGNIFLYVALFIFLIRAFENFGFSPAAIAAGMGSLALAVSLGAQNFVADIIAGLTYVFEGTFHAGDNVQISVGGPAFEGKVVEIGVRCIKLLTREGDIITCYNRDVRTIKNATQLNSCVICEINVSSEISAEELEEMLEKELSAIGEKDGRILSGPVYNGVIAIDKGMMTLSVSAECRVEDYYYVRDKVNVSLQRIFREHGYSI